MGGFEWLIPPMTHREQYVTFPEQCSAGRPLAHQSTIEQRTAEQCTELPLSEQCQTEQRLASTFCSTTIK